MIAFLAGHPLLTIMIVLAAGALLGQVSFGPLRFGAAGALFMGLVIGAVDPRLGGGLGLVKSLGVVLFCYTVGLSSGSTFLGDLRRQWGLMLAGVVGLVVMGAAVLGLAVWFGLSPAHAAGAYAGVLTSPAIDAAITATAGSGDTLVGYAMAYPTGVIVAMFVVALTIGRGWPGSRDTKSLADAGITAASLRVERDTALEDIPGWSAQRVRLSYLERSGSMRVVSSADELRAGDRVLVVGDPEDVAAAQAYLGRHSGKDLTAHRHHVDFRRFVVTNPDLIGRPIASLNVEGRLRGIVTRVQRDDLDLLARDDIVLEPGDRVLAVVPRHHMQDAADFFGDSERRVSQVDALTLGLGIALGLLVGSVSVPLPGGVEFSLGAAVGPLVVGMVLGAVQRTGPFRWMLPRPANSVIRQLGLMLFLATVGLASGPEFIAQAFSWTGARIIIVCVLALMVGAVVQLAGGYLFGLSAQRTTGAFAGFVGQPALLSYAESRSNDERIGAAYAALFALGTVVKILVVQFVAHG